MAKLAPLKHKKEKAKASRFAAVPCLVLLITGFTLVSLLFYYTFAHSK